MTLTKTKKRRPTVRSQKRVASHHRKDDRYIRAYWPYLPMVAIILLGVACNSWLNRVHHSVLGYATDISIQNIVADTNAQRAANGLGNLSNNGQLNQAAQAKANDMAARDYWSHNTPDGQTPWTFITAAGYSYSTAGENLAYGFTTAAATLDGWMNSPGHRANILNSSFVDVGVGIANIPNYQNSGPQTLVVAMYGAPLSAPAPAPAPAAPPVPTPVASVVPRSQSTPTTAEPPQAANETPLQTSVPEPTPDTPATPSPEQPTATAAKPQTAVVHTEPQQKKVSRAELIAASPAASLSAAATTFVSLALIGFILIRHGFAWRRYMKNSEKFVLHHPLIDIAAILVVVIGAILSQTAGLIR